jgi:hypothetical protein
MQKRFYIPATTTSRILGRRYGTGHQQPPAGQLASWDTEAGCGGRGDEEEEDEGEEVPASLFLQHVGLLQAEGGAAFRKEFHRLEGKTGFYLMTDICRGPTELVQHSVHRGSSHRRKGAASHLNGMVWLYILLGYPSGKEKGIFTCSY